MLVLEPQSVYRKQKRDRLNLPKFSSSCFVLDSWVPNRKHDSSSDIVHIPLMAEGDTKSTYTTVEKYRSAQKLNKSNTFEFLFFLPHTWQNLQRRQHQFSLFSSDGCSAGSRQKRWKGSQHTWQCSICKNQHIKIINLSVNKIYCRVCFVATCLKYDLKACLYLIPLRKM